MRKNVENPLPIFIHKRTPVRTRGSALSFWICSRYRRNAGMRSFLSKSAGFHKNKSKFSQNKHLLFKQTHLKQMFRGLAELFRIIHRISTREITDLATVQKTLVL
jgi:hypothetical protein